MILAIDFGTSRTRAAVKVSANAAPVPVTLGETADVPNAVYVEPDGRILTGDSAWNKRRSADPIRFFAGKQFKLALRGPAREIDGKTYEWVDLVEAVLREALVKAEKEFDAAGKFKTLILTVPAMYDEGAQAWQVMEEAGRRLGLELAPLVREPHAAASWYAKLLRDGGKEIQPGEIVMVFDLGGGTFDAALMRVTAKGYESLQAGGVECGGTLFDELLMQDFAARFAAPHEATLPAAEETLVQKRSRIQRRAALEDFLQRTVKHQLAEAEVVEDDEPVLLEDRYRLTRDAFNRMIAPLLDSTIRCCEELVEREGISWTEVKRIVMVGASCRLPVVREKLAEMIARNGAGDVEMLWRRVGDADVRPEVAVVLGAANGGGAAVSSRSRAAVQVIPQIVDPAVLVACSPDGKMLLTNKDGVFKVWCLETLRVRRERYVANVLGAPRFSIDNGRLLFDIRDSAPTVWDLRTGKIEYSLMVPDEWMPAPDAAWEEKFKNSRAAKTLPSGETTDLWCRLGVGDTALVFNKDSARWAIWEAGSERFVDSGRLSDAFRHAEALIATPGQNLRVVVQTRYNPAFESFQLYVVDLRTGSAQPFDGLVQAWSDPQLVVGGGEVIFQSCRFGSECFAKHVGEFDSSPKFEFSSPKGLAYFHAFSSGRSLLFRNREKVFCLRDVGSHRADSGEELILSSTTSFALRTLHIPLASRDYVLYQKAAQGSRQWSLVKLSDQAERTFHESLKNPAMKVSGDRIALVSRGDDRQTYVYVIGLERFPHSDSQVKFPVGKQRFEEITWAGDTDRLVAATDNTAEPMLLGLLVGESKPLWSLSIEQHAWNLSADASGTRVCARVGADEVILVDTRSGEIVARRKLAGPFTGEVHLCSSGEIVATMLTTGAVRLTHMFEAEEVTLYLFRRGYIAYDGDGNFDASPELMRYVSIDAGDRLLTTAEELAPFHKPDVVQSILSRL